MSRAGCCNTVITTKCFDDSDMLWRANFNSDTSCIGILHDNTDGTSGLIICGQKTFSQRYIASEYQSFIGQDVVINKLNDYTDFQNRAYIVGEDLSTLSINSGILGYTGNLDGVGHYASFEVTKDVNTITCGRTFAGINYTAYGNYSSIGTVSGIIPNLSSSSSSVWSGIFQTGETLSNGDPYDIAIIYGGGGNNVNSVDGNMYATYSYDEGQIIDDLHNSGVSPSLNAKECFAIRNESGLYSFIQTPTYLLRLKDNIIDGAISITRENHNLVYDNTNEKINLVSRIYPVGYNLRKDDNGVPIWYNDPHPSRSGYVYDSVDMRGYYDSLITDINDWISKDLVKSADATRWLTGDEVIDIASVNSLYLTRNGVKASGLGNYLTEVAYTISGYTGYNIPQANGYGSYKLVNGTIEDVQLNALYQLNPFSFAVEKVLDLPTISQNYAEENSPINGILRDPTKIGFVEDITKAQYTALLNKYLNPAYEVGDIESETTFEWHPELVQQTSLVREAHIAVENAEYTGNTVLVNGTEQDEYDGVVTKETINYNDYNLIQNVDDTNRYIESQLEFKKSIGNVSSIINAVHLNKDRLYVTYSNSFDVLYKSYRFSSAFRYLTTGLFDPSEVVSLFQYSVDVNRPYIKSYVDNEYNNTIVAVGADVDECVEAELISTSQAIANSATKQTFANFLAIKGIDSITNTRYSEHAVNYGKILTGSSAGDIRFLVLNIGVPGARFDENTGDHIAYLWDEVSRGNTFKNKFFYKHSSNPIGVSAYVVLPLSYFNIGVYEDTYYYDNVGMYLVSSTVPDFSSTQDIKILVESKTGLLVSNTLATVATPYKIARTAGYRYSQLHYVENQQWKNVVFSNYINTGTTWSLVKNEDSEIIHALIIVSDMQGGVNGGNRTYTGGSNELVINQYASEWIYDAPPLTVFKGPEYYTSSVFAGTSFFSKHVNGENQSIVGSSAGVRSRIVGYTNIFPIDYNITLDDDGIASISSWSQPLAQIFYTEPPGIDYGVNGIGINYGLAASVEFGASLSREVFTVNAFDYMKLLLSFQDGQNYIDIIPEAASLQAMCPWLTIGTIPSDNDASVLIEKQPVIDTMISISEERVAIYDLNLNLISDESISEKYNVEYPTYQTDDIIIPEYEVTSRVVSQTLVDQQPEYLFETQYNRVNGTTGDKTFTYTNTSTEYTVGRQDIGIIPPLYGNGIISITGFSPETKLSIYDINSNLGNTYQFSSAITVDGNVIHGEYSPNVYANTATMAIGEELCFVDFTHALESIYKALSFDDGFIGWYGYDYYVNSGWDYMNNIYNGFPDRGKVETTYKENYKSFLLAGKNRYYYPKDYLLRAKDDNAYIISKDITKWVDSYSDANLSSNRIDVNYFSNGTFMIPEASFHDTDIKLELGVNLSYLEDRLDELEYVEGVVDPDHIKVVSFDGTNYNYLAEILTPPISGVFWPYVNDVVDSGNPFVRDFLDKTNWTYKAYRLYLGNKLFKYNFHTVDSGDISKDITDYLSTVGYDKVNSVECYIDNSQFGQISTTINNSGYYSYNWYTRDYYNLTNTGGWLFPQEITYGIEHFPTKDDESYQSVPSVFKFTKDGLDKEIEFVPAHYSDLNADGKYLLDSNNGIYNMIYSEPVDIVEIDNKYIITGIVMSDSRAERLPSSGDDFSLHHSRFNDFTDTSNYNAMS